MSDYEPKYIQLSNVPFGPDDYEPSDKREALELAEARFELDFNGGREFDPNAITNAHSTAVKALATHVLTLTAEDSDSVSVGDLTSDADSVLEYSTEWKNLYMDQLKSMRQAEADSDSSGTGGHVYSTHQ